MKIDPGNGKYFALAQCGTEMVLPLIGGIFIDRWLGTTPIFTIVTMILGFVGGLTHMVILSNQIQREEDAKRKQKKDEAAS